MTTATAKRCSHCDGTAVYKSGRCVPCHRAASRRNGAARRERSRALILAAKDRPCITCGMQLESHRMHLDHVWGTKTFDIGRDRHRALKSIEAEISLCVVRCASCHARRHGLERSIVAGLRKCTELHRELAAEFDGLLGAAR